MAYVKVKECLSDPRQLVKLIFLVVCVCITIYQLSECVSKIVCPPIISYSKFRYNKTIKYPALTICRRPPYKKDLFKSYGIPNAITDLTSMDVFQNFPFNSSTIEEFMKAATYSFEETIAMYGYKGDGNLENIETKSSFYPARGRCHTIIPKETAETFRVGTGYWFYLMHTNKDNSKDSVGFSTSGFEIHIHNDNDVVKEETTIDTGFVYLEAGEDMYVVLNVQAFSRISTTQEPCVSDPNYSKSLCEEKCVHNAIAEKLGCSVPWLRNLEKNYSECSNAESLQRMGSYFSVNFREKYLKNCNCPGPCSSFVYRYQIENRRECDTIVYPSSIITLYFAGNLITELSEVASYDWNLFLSDVGGSLGFLLGLSVIGIVTVIEEIIREVIKRRNKKAKKLNKEESQEKLPHLIQGGTAEGESLKTVMEFMANCDMYQHLQEEKMKSKGTKEIYKY